MLLLGVLSLLPLVTSAQTEVADSVNVLFRFVADRDMFYYTGNADAIDEVCRLLNPQSLAEGAVRVDGYSRTKALSKIRSNRVKSEFIVRSGLSEVHFTTRNHAGTFEGRSNVVVVTIPLYKDTVKALPVETAEPIPETNTVQDSVPNEVQKKEEPQPTTVEQETVESKETVTLANEGKSQRHSLSLRANLLRWATLSPDLGVEWRIDGTWGVLVNASYTSWSWNDKDRRFGLWEVNPEVRRYMGAKQRGYVGVMYKVGSFNYKFSETGRQGDLMGGGITGGYTLPIGKAFCIDFSLGLGYLRAETEKYNVIDGVRVRQGKENKNWWGPTSAGVTLVWKIF